MRSKDLRRQAGREEQRSGECRPHAQRQQPAPAEAPAHSRFLSPLLRMKRAVMSSKSSGEGTLPPPFSAMARLPRVTAWFDQGRGGGLGG